MKVTALISVTLAAAVGLGCAALSVESVESASTEGAVDSEWVKPPFTASPLAPCKYLLEAHLAIWCSCDNG